MKMKITIAAAAVFCALLPGCNKPDTGGQPPQAGVKPDAAQQPYYYGLIEEYRAILAEDPDNLAGIIALANAYFDSGQWKEAIAFYERALRINPHDPDIRTDLGTSYRNIGMPDRALTEYHTALQYDPVHLNARYNMGIVYAYDKKDYGRAVQVWEELLRLSPSYSRADSMRLHIKSFKKMAGKGER